MTRRMILAVLAALAVGTAAAGAGERAHPEDDIAIGGYDPVAYFTEGRPVRGSAEHAHEWQDRTWHFSTSEHLEAFAGEPRRYAPRYGGFCAGAMALGWRAPVDPEAFAIIDGRLYLAFHRDGIEDFEENAERDVPRADANWERLSK